LFVYYYDSELAASAESYILRLSFNKDLPYKVLSHLDKI